MANHKLDEIDRRILAELQADGRMTNVELARRVGISAPPCLRRVRALEEAGLIRGYHADIDPRATLQTLYQRFQPIPLEGTYWTAQRP